jgi:hypothetical protein
MTTGDNHETCVALPDIIVISIIPSLKREHHARLMASESQAVGPRILQRRLTSGVSCREPYTLSAHSRSCALLEWCSIARPLIDIRAIQLALLYGFAQFSCHGSQGPKFKNIFELVTGHRGHFRICETGHKIGKKWLKNPIFLGAARCSV